MDIPKFLEIIAVFAVIIGKYVYFLHEIIYIIVIKVNIYRDIPMKDCVFKAIKRHGNLLTTDMAIRSGVSKTMLARYVDKGELVHVRHGLYALPDSIIDSMYAIHLQNPSIIFSHESALFLNGFAERTPFKHSITIRSDKVVPQSIKEQCSIFYVKPEFLKIGLSQRKTTFGNLVPCYDAERTLCDILRSRRRIDDETAIAAIKNYAKMAQKNLFNLYDYATRLSVISTVQQYMEVLV